MDMKMLRGFYVMCFSLAGFSRKAMSCFINTQFEMVKTNVVTPHRLCRSFLEMGTVQQSYVDSFLYIHQHRSLNT